ncbi:unnamed protein product [marine sediment metagenome]|uniref:Uncharacterized protein n=1 Tax=marine sediment metagenome TaxID=412755 RepID=X1MFU7_9ZZZZ
MTQAELDSIARKMRARGLHSSWDELLTFSKDVVGGLADAYQALLKSTAKSDKVPSTNPDNVQKVMRDKLAAVLTVLTSKAQVARWESEALAGNSILGTWEVDDQGLKKISHKRNRGR